VRAIHVHIDQDDYILLKELAATTGLALAALVRFALAQTYHGADGSPIEVEHAVAAQPRDVEDVAGACVEAASHPNGDVAPHDGRPNRGRRATRTGERSSLGIELVVEALDARAGGLAYADAHERSDEVAPDAGAVDAGEPFSPPSDGGRPGETTPELLDDVGVALRLRQPDGRRGGDEGIDVETQEHAGNDRASELPSPQVGVVTRCANCGGEIEFEAAPQERGPTDRAEPEADATVHGADGSGTRRPVEAKRFAQAGLVGIRGKAAERAADWLARRTRLSSDVLKTLLGAYLVLSRINSFRKMARRARAGS
jgi:hypothetical protein